MATSDNPCIPIPKKDSGSPETHQHDVPIVNVDDKEQETLERNGSGDVETGRGGVLLEFDEDDALFDKRSGVKDSHGRS